MEQTLSKQQTRFAVSASRLKSPLKDIQMQQSELGSLQQRLETQRLSFLKNAAQEFETVTQRLEAVSPLKTLHRGYAMVLAKDDDGNRVILKDSTDMKEGDQVDTQLGLGSFRSTVTSTSTDSIVADIIPTAKAPITNAPTAITPTTKEDKNGNPAS